MTPTPNREASKTAEEIVREIAYTVFQECKNRHRLYPDSNHSFSDYWNTAEDNITSILQSPPVQSTEKQEQDPCNRCGKTLREQMKGCDKIYCYRQFLRPATPPMAEQQSVGEESILELMTEAKELVEGLLPGEDHGESPEAERLWNILEQVQASSFVVVEGSIMQLFETIKHGDDNHQMWLKEKMIDWLRTRLGEQAKEQTR